MKTVVESVHTFRNSFSFKKIFESILRQFRLTVESRANVCFNDL